MAADHGQRLTAAPAEGRADVTPAQLQDVLLPRRAPPNVWNLQEKPFKRRAAGPPKKCGRLACELIGGMVHC
jgi:hypothetical protein